MNASLMMKINQFTVFYFQLSSSSISLTSNQQNKEETEAGNVLIDRLIDQLIDGFCLCSGGSAGAEGLPGGEAPPAGGSLRGSRHRRVSGDL